MPSLRAGQAVGRPISPSEQGQPVIFSAGGGENGLELAGRYANGVIAAVFTVEDAPNQRQAYRDATQRAGRNPDEIKFFAGVMPAIGKNKQAALDRRVQLGELTAASRVPYLGSMLNLQLDAGRVDESLTPAQLQAASASPFDPRSARALQVAREGWTTREILADGVIDYHQDYEGGTLRDHLGAPAQYGLGMRLTDPV